MDFTGVPTLKQRKKADLLVIPFWKGKKKAELAASAPDFEQEFELPLDTEDFKGKEGEVLVLYLKNGAEKRLALLGLGEKQKSSVEGMRRAYSSLVRQCFTRKIETLNVLLPEVEGSIKGASEGLLLSNYAFEKLKRDSLKDKATQLLTSCAFVGAGSKEIAEAKKAALVCESVAYARDLVNGNADDVTPQTLAQEALALTKQYKSLKTTVFDKKRIEKEQMGLLLAVNRGSHTDPAFIILEYKGNSRSKDTTVIVGKGVTYDTGGLNIKPTGSMETMKCDMSGAAIALGTMRAAAAIGLKQNIIAVIPATENSIGSNSYKPGDVYFGYSGKSVEIANTDAEGRLILADALAYSVKNLKPSRIIDFATLTGAVVICLGEETTGMMSNDDQLAEALTKAGEATFERVWRLPLFDEYKKQIESEIADIKNSGGRPAGTITAALFLKEFVGDVPWAHLDVAGTAYLSKARHYNPKNASGVGVRLMIEFFEQMKS